MAYRHNTRRVSVSTLSCVIIVWLVSMSMEPLLLLVLPPVLVFLGISAAMACCVVAVAAYAGYLCFTWLIMTPVDPSWWFPPHTFSPIIRSYFFFLGVASFGSAVAEIIKTNWQRRTGKETAPVGVKRALCMVGACSIMVVSFTYCLTLLSNDRSISKEYRRYAKLSLDELHSFVRDEEKSTSERLNALAVLGGGLVSDQLIDQRIKIINALREDRGLPPPIQRAAPRFLNRLHMVKEVEKEHGRPRMWFQSEDAQKEEAYYTFRKYERDRY